MTRTRILLVFALVAVFLSGGLVANAAKGDPCNKVFTANSIAKLKAYDECRFDRIEAKLNTQSTSSPTPAVTPSATAKPSPTPSTASPTFTTSPAPAGVQPTKANTGPRSAATQTIGGTVDVNSKQAISRVHYTGSVHINAGGTGTTLTDVTIDGAVVIYNAASVAIDYTRIAGLYTEGFKDLTIDHSFFGDQSDTFMQLSCNSTAKRADNFILRNSLFDGLVASPANSGKHLQAIHFMGVHGATLSNNVFRYVGPDQATTAQISSVVQYESSFAGRRDENIAMIGNWYFGGSPYYQTAPEGPGHVFRDNRFTKPPSATVQQSTDYQTPTSQSGNLLDGKPFSLPGN